MDLKFSSPVSFDCRVSFERYKKSFNLTLYEGVALWDTSNWAYYMKVLLNLYSKYPLLMFNDDSFWTMFEKVAAIESMGPYPWHKTYSFLKAIKNYSNKVMRLFGSDTCLVLSRTPLPAVLCREVLGYLFGDVDTLFPAPKKEVLRVHRSIKSASAAAVKAVKAASKKKGK
jgi:hypothetical protein